MNLFRLFGEIVVANEKANKAIDDTVEKANGSKSKLNSGIGAIGKVATKAVGYTTTAVAAVAGLMVSLADNTRDYRTEMAKLDTAFTTSGHSSETARKTYKDLQAVLGDTNQAVEAANHLAKLTDNEKDLHTWTDICTGVFATFGDSLPIEGLTESANETAKVGEVTGSLADALNWAGINEDDFNAKLAACTTEQERQQLIMDTLIGTYKDAAEQYKNINEKVIASNEAHDNLNAAMAKLGDAAEPAVTMVINAVAKLAESATPVIQALSDAILFVGEAWETMNQKVAVNGAALGIDMDAMNADPIGYTLETQKKTKKTGLELIRTAFGGADGSHAGGLFRVPFDGYLALLHKDETVLNRMDAREYRFAQATGGSAIGTGRLESLMGSMVGLMQQIVANTSTGQNIVLDSGALVGQLAPRMDQQLGTLASRRGRG